MAVIPDSHSRHEGLVPHLIHGVQVHALTWLGEVVAVNAAFLAAAFARYAGQIPALYEGRRAILAVAMITVGYTVFDLLFHTYRIVWRFASVIDMAELALTILGTIVTIGILELGPMVNDRPIPFSVLALGGAMAYLLLAHLKLLPLSRMAVTRGRDAKPLIVFGAGSGGIALVRQLRVERSGYRAVAFLDDDLHKVGRDIAGLPVIGTRADIEKGVKRFGAHAVAIAIPSAQSKTIREISNRALDADARALVLPSISELMAGSKLTLREVGIEDLVGRSEVTVDEKAIRAAFSDRRVLITGAAGSIGSELSRQVAALQPAQLDLLDNNETGLAELRDELQREGLALGIVVASITDENAIQAAFDSSRPDVVIHAAALKHVDIVEDQPRGAVEVNVRGTWICAQAAQRAEVKRFMFVSTDKAVDPEGVLGASKRIGELMMASLSSSRTIFAAVRFGNVLGSRGSVLPRFERQISQGGPITVTHPDIKRFFMSIAEAVRLVLQSAAFAEPGRTYVLDMGEEMSIAAFAQRLVRFRGLRIPDDIAIVYTGLRAGERMHEALVGEGEAAVATTHPKIMEVAMRSDQRSFPWAETVSDLVAEGTSSDGRDLRTRLMGLAAPPRHSGASTRR